jgi:hypothetical protein
LNYDYQDQQPGILSTLGQYMAMPIGLGMGAYGLGKLWSGSPALRGAAAVGLPLALYKYMQYASPENFADNVAGANKQFREQLLKNDNMSNMTQEQYEQAQSDIQQKVRAKYMEPGKSALYDALPYFGVGAALPAALAMLGRRQ